MAMLLRLFVLASAVELSMVVASPLAPLRPRTYTPAYSANTSTNPSFEIYPLSPDPEFHFELIRPLSLTTYEGADVSEVLLAANSIAPGNFTSIADAFIALGQRTLATANAIDAARFPVSARTTLLKAATYLRTADFWLKGDWNDPRLETLWNPMLDAFDRAVKLYPHYPGTQLEVKAQDGSFTIPAYFFPGDDSALATNAQGGHGGHKGRQSPRQKPTVIMASGFDGTLQEMWHQMGLAAVQRGINVLLYEGPGQQTVRRQQGIGFIPQWERVVTPLIDLLVSPSFAFARHVNPAAIGLAGVSFGGYLAPRAAAYEPRLAALIAIDGIHDFGGSIIAQYTVGGDANPLKAAWESGNATRFDATLLGMLPRLPSQARWFVEQGLWAFNTHSPFDWWTQMTAYKLDAAQARQIRCPTFVADADQDTSFPGQAKVLADMIGEKATYHLFEGRDGAGLHCSVGAFALQNQVVYDWFEEVVGAKS